MADPKSLKLSPVSVPQFQEGISLVLSRWSALQLAVENEWGGRNSRAVPVQLASDIFSWFNQSKVEIFIDELEDLLHEALLSLNTEADDGSVEEIAADLAIMHDQCVEGNYESVHKLRQAAASAVPVRHFRQAANDEDDDDDDDADDEYMENRDTSNMMVDGPESSTSHGQTLKNGPSPRVEEDEDGWVTVASRKGRGRNN